MAEVSRFGPMARDMMDSERMVLLKATEEWSTLMETSMKESGKMTSSMGLGSLQTALVIITLENGLKTLSMAMV
jgi:hypothetical protein